MAADATADVGASVVETTDALGCFEQALTIERGPLCCHCRGWS